jgi:predicted nucleotidyltransferase
MDLKFYLEELLGTSVDLVTDKALRPQVRQAIEGELINVA